MVCHHEAVTHVLAHNLFRKRNGHLAPAVQEHSFRGQTPCTFNETLVSVLKAEQVFDVLPLDGEKHLFLGPVLLCDKHSDLSAQKCMGFTPIVHIQPNTGSCLTNIFRVPASCRDAYALFRRDLMRCSCDQLDKESTHLTLIFLFCSLSIFFEHHHDVPYQT